MRYEESTNFVKLADETEESDDYSNDDLYNIDSWGSDLSFRELITMYSEEDLLKPEIQRKYVWDRSEASRFIESILLGLPVPSIFLAKRNDQRFLIIDGYQRIMTVFDFVEKGIFSKDGKTFKLSNSPRINGRWRGKSFNELSGADQRKIRSTTIHAIMFQQKEPRNDDSSLFQVFERINTSGRTLMSQEIRNCVYQGSFNKLLIELNKYPTWRTLFGTKTGDARMKDIEFILRFFALSSINWSKFDASSISLKKTLNDYMNHNVNISENDAVELTQRFNKTMDFIFNNIGEDAFFNISKDGKTVKKLHPTIFDSVAIATLNFIQNSHTTTLSTQPNKRRLQLLRDADYTDYISIRTTNTDHISGRIRKAGEYLYGADF